MNALRSVINTTDVDPACRGACKKALEANACGIVEPKRNCALEEDQNEKRAKLPAKMKDVIVVSSLSKSWTT
ncbi:hypothetical protein DD238_007906 [Peronospora effusa]|uniref:Uncharacterized protein n=1 Tax=Peronospora effusa TaxID=542832 RepID=A0A3M6V6U3_9STRA|nr:hypothetical protein DD238_007906 [Peronospora effusa]